MNPARDVLLSVSHLTTVFDLPGGSVAAVDDVSFLEIRAGETLGLVGESGSGEIGRRAVDHAVSAAAGRIAAGAILFKGRFMPTREAEMRSVRGADISLVFQEPQSALNPVFTVGDQIAETLLVHRRATRREAGIRAVELLDAVHVPDPAARARDYPHQLSGGMRQRVLIAMALACKPSLVIADEPTTALDVTRFRRRFSTCFAVTKSALNLSLLLITHDLGIIAETADRVAVMYAGRIVEEGSVRAILREPKHPYTIGLLASIPGGTPASGCARSQAPCQRSTRYLRAALSVRAVRIGSTRARRRCHRISGCPNTARGIPRPTLPPSRATITSACPPSRRAIRPLGQTARTDAAGRGLSPRQVLHQGPGGVQSRHP